MEIGNGVVSFFFLEFSNSWATHMLGRRRLQDLKHSMPHAVTPFAFPQQWHVPNG